MNENPRSIFSIPQRILLGPGPSNIPPRVQAAMQAPILGYFDPQFFILMDETVALLRKLYRTQNKLTLPLSGTGSAGMEAGAYNFLEPGDTAVIGINGFFGERLAELAQRSGANVVRVNGEWGKPLAPELIESALKAQKKVNMVGLIHAETSTGAITPLPDIAKLAHKYDALFLADAVTSLGAHEVSIDDWGVDICYSGSQKGISCPPGLAPITANDKAMAKLAARKCKVNSWYLDLSLLANYWTNTPRVYHHTAPALMVYAFRESLLMIMEEGLENRWARHQKNAAALQAGLEAMGLQLFAQKGYRLNTLTCVRIPAGVDDARIRSRLLNEYNIEIGGGLGQLKGQAWRIGLMGYSSSQENVLLLLSVLEKLLGEAGYKAPAGAGLTAAVKVFEKK